MKHHQLRILLALWLVATASAPAAVRYVDVNSANPTPPYTDWATAATTIQDAVDAGDFFGDEILVTNGVYQTGGKVFWDALTSRVVVDKPVAIQSVNGPEFTFIQGYQVPGTTNGDGAIRCVYLGSGASLSGFTLTQGATRTAGDSTFEQSGGGVLCASASAVVSNCVITGNAASSLGGGACSGTLIDCTLDGNSAGAGGGASGGTLNNCTLTGNSAGSGGGSSGGILNNCTLMSNSAGSGGGASGGTLNNCRLTGNLASSSGGGVSGGILNNCTLTGNSASSGGGGASGGTLKNCVITSNSTTAAYANGGGVSGSTLNNCDLRGNTASYDGGGAFGGSLINCTVTGNSASGSGGGVAAGPNGSCALTNCIVYYNQAHRFGDNFDLSTTLNFCCTTPLPFDGEGNLTAEPQLAGNWHLSPDSPCRGAGTAVSATGLDLDGQAWANPPSIGCDEYQSGSVTGALGVAIVASYTNVATGFAVDFQELISGRVNASRWEFGDGTVVSNRPYTSHVWNAAGDYQVVLRAYNESHPDGMIASVTVQVVNRPVHHVAHDSPGPTPPYSTWLTAATNIQDAVNAATVPGALVVVSNGVYEAGITIVSGASNRVAVTKPLRVESVNGPDVTTIVGAGQPEPVRCVYLAGGSMLTGFTLTNGTTQTSGFDQRLTSGGGIYGEWPSAVVSNCIITGNRAYAGGGAAGGTLINCTLIGNGVGAYQSGGGAFGSRLLDCTLTNNWASWGGGASDCTLDRCMLIGNRGADSSFFPIPFAGYGGGTDRSVLDHCLVISNSAASGGGVSYSQLRNCKLLGNSATGTFPYNGGFGGGGALEGTLVNCTVAGNSAPVGGGLNGSTLRSSIVYFNSSPDGPNYGLAFSPHVSAFDYCCTTPLPASGMGNITNAPLFLDLAAGDYRLQASSPCINAGFNGYVTGENDLDGNPRIAGGTVDMGPYEFQSPASVLSYAWLQQYGLPTDGSADYSDSDVDLLNNWQEWIAGTIPTDALSALRMSEPIIDASGILVSWQSVGNRTYFVERSANLGATPSFSRLIGDIPGREGSTTYTDPSPAGSGSFYYRVGVQE